MPTYEITSPAQLQETLKNIVIEVIEAVSKDLLEIFKEDYIQKEVYDGHKPNVKYNPTGEFYDAWEFTDVEVALKEVTTELWYNWMSMGYDPDTYTHSSASSNWPNDTREHLADWLNRTVSSSHWFSVKRNERYWNKFIREQVTENRIDKLFKKHFALRGIS